MTISLEQLGAPRTQGELIIQAMFKNQDNDNPVRFSDATDREFELRANLLKGPLNDHSINGAFDASNGSSYLLSPPDVTHFEVETSYGTLRLDTNDSREISMASASIWSTNQKSARHQFLAMLALYFDRMSYVSSIPFHIGMIVNRDVIHEVQYINFISPPRNSIIDPGGEELT